MNYDFDKIIPRRNSGCCKWDKSPYDDILPMWVADMDFQAAPEIISALRKRVEHGIFGYTQVPDSYYEAIVRWFRHRHKWDINPADIIYTTGVVPALSAIIKGLTRPGDNVIVQTPAYNSFFSSIRNNGCVALANQLRNDNGSYSIDFDHLQQCAADPKTTLMIICNPHNPVGRLWSEHELVRIAEICRQNNVIPVSDEIHCELTYNGKMYNPFANIAKSLGIPSIVCVSPSKAFNIAGLQIANIIADDPEQYRLIDRAINDNEVCDVNPFGVTALTAAYDHGEEWLDALLGYIWNNYLTVKDYFGKNLPQYTLSPLEATYLLWIDVTPSGLNGEEIAHKLEQEYRLLVCPGNIYGQGGENFIRLNIACPNALVRSGLQKLNELLGSF